MATPRKPSKAAQEAALWKARATTIKAEYDVLKSTRLRRQPVRETKDEGAIYTPSKRAYGTNIGRDLERNYSPARGILHQFRMNVAGTLGKLQVNVEGGVEAGSWFNQVWAKNCDLRDSIHWSTFLQNVVAAILREGDMLSVFDDGLIEDSGKLITWESDQIAPLSEDVLKLKGYGDSVQDGGIIRDKWGRVLAYSVTGKRGMTVISEVNDALVWKRDQARLPRNPWRLNQGRGVPCILTAAASFLDLYEMLSRELQTAKRAAAQWAFITRENAVTDWDSPATGAGYLPENDGKNAATVAGEGANSTTEPEARNYESLEDFTGGYTDYGQTGDKVDFSPTDRPNIHMPEFIEAVQCQAGAAFGLARAYSLLRADSSYTSFRGDMILSWAGAFYPMQKWLERDLADWVGVKALTWAMRKKLIPKLPQGWEQSLSWTWPTMPEVDELDAQNAIAMSLKNGTTDYSALLGPDWRKRLEGLSEQIEVIKQLGIPLSILEMKSGGVADNPKKDKEQPVKTEGTK
jgi:capsid protein